MFHGGFTEKHKRPGGREATGCFPFVLNSLVSVPRAVGHGALEKTVLGRFLGARITNLALGGDPHKLEPGADQEALVEGKPNEGAHFPWAGIVQNSSDCLRGCGVLKIEALYESDHARSVHWFSGVVVASFGGVAKERSVPKSRGGLPMPLLWVPWDVTTPLWPSVGVKPNTSKVRDLESSGTPECLGFDNKAQNTSH